MPERADAAAPDDRETNPLHDFVGFYLRVAHEAHFDDFRRRTGSQALRPGLFAILAIIERNPGINQTSLGQITNRQKSTLTTSLRILERHGLVRRTRLESDRRNYALELTDAGRGKVAEFWVHARAGEAAMTAIIGPEKARELLRLLRQIWDGLS